MEDIYSDEGRLPIRRLTEHVLKYNPTLFDKPVRTEEIRNRQRTYSHKWFRNNRLSSAISSHMRISLRNNKSGQHWEQLVHYTLDDVRNHLERLFKDDMTWNNYGDWEIDHVIPVSAFDFNSPDDPQFKLCWALENLQPLWKRDNRRKHNKITKPKQIRLDIPPAPV